MAVRVRTALVVIGTCAWLLFEAAPALATPAMVAKTSFYVWVTLSDNAQDNITVTVVNGEVRIADPAGIITDPNYEAVCSHGNVVSSRVYLTDLSAFQQMNDAYRTYFPSMRPVRATVKAGLAGKDALVEITMIASSSPRSPIDDGRPANPNLSAAIRAGNRVYVSGMLGNMPDNKADISSQTRETLARIRKALEVAGCTPADVVDSMVYLPDLTKFAEMNEVYRSFFERISTPPRTGRAVGTPGFPARATVGSALVAPDGLVEIMATAVKP